MAVPTPHCPLRIDLHCHSMASNEADEAVLNAINCPESYSEPWEVYEQAKRRGMNFVTITDHDSIAGIYPLLSRHDAIIGEEVTCYFPEDRCKIHLLVWGLTPADHDAMQAVGHDIYQVAEYVEKQNLAHSVAHPVYRQNDVLELWHLERLALMFKGFECLNGAHSALHREALEPFVDGLTQERIETLSRRHGMMPRWPKPWIKARTGGSDDHGLFNVGRTWTEFPADATTVPAILQCIREARCRPGGEAGSSIKLAHNFFGVGIRYYARQIAPPNSAPGTLLGLLTGERQPRTRVAMAMVRGWASGVRRRVGRVISRRKHPQGGTSLLADVMGKSLKKRLAQAPLLRSALRAGKAPLAEHAAMFELVSAVNRDVAEGIRSAVSWAMKDGEFAPVFDAISAVAAHQFILAPYYFALFHQNRERHVLGRVTGNIRPRDGRALRLGVFSDTLDSTSGIGRFIRTAVEHGCLLDLAMTVATSTASKQEDVKEKRSGSISRLSPAAATGNAANPARPPGINADRCAESSHASAYKNFAPLASIPMPFYPQASLSLPPALEILEWADRQQFDAIHVHTPGPMGLCALLVAKMLRVPLVATFHVDFAKYVHGLTGDYRLTSTAGSYLGWFYNQATTVLARSRSAIKTLEALGVKSEKIVLLPAGVDGEKFNPSHRNIELWQKLGVKESTRILYAGRLSVEKNLPMLAEAFKKLCLMRPDVALIIAGDGPYRAQMRNTLAGLPVYFLGSQEDESLRVLYASSDLFVFPSRTDTLGQAVMEAQASGLPVLVSEEGGPREMMDDGVTGLVLPGSDAAAWADAMDKLLEDAPRRLRMGRTAPQRMGRYTPVHAFEAFWEAHVNAAAGAAQKAEGAASQAAGEPVAHAGVNQ